MSRVTGAIWPGQYSAGWSIRATLSRYCSPYKKVRWMGRSTGCGSARYRARGQVNSRAPWLLPLYACCAPCAPEPVTSLGRDLARLLRSLSHEIRAIHQPWRLLSIEQYLIDLDRVIQPLDDANPPTR